MKGFCPLQNLSLFEGKRDTGSEVDNMSLVAVVMGSKSDAGVMQATLDILDSQGISYEVSVISAHRTPEKVRQFALDARERGVEVIIAAPARRFGKLDYFACHRRAVGH